MTQQQEKMAKEDNVSQDMDTIGVVLTDIIERTTRDVNHMMQMVHHWNLEECTSGEENNGKSNLGPGTLERVDEYLDDFFSSRRVFTEEQGGEVPLTRENIQHKGNQKKQKRATSKVKKRRASPLSTSTNTTGMVDAMQNFLPTMLTVVQNIPDPNIRKTCPDKVSQKTISLSKSVLSNAGDSQVSTTKPSTIHPRAPLDKNTFNLEDISAEITKNTQLCIASTMEYIMATMTTPAEEQPNPTLPVAEMVMNHNLSAFAQALLDGFIKAEGDMKRDIPDMTHICNEAFKETCTNTQALIDVGRNDQAKDRGLLSSDTSRLQEIRNVNGNIQPGTTTAAENNVDSAFVVVTDTLAEVDKESSTVSSNVSLEMDLLQETETVDTILTDIVQQASIDVIHMMQRVHRWDYEESPTSDEKGDKNVLGPVTMQRVDNYIDRFFARRKRFGHEHRSKYQLAEDYSPGKREPKNTRRQDKRKVDKKRVPQETSSHSNAEIVEAIRNFLPSMLDIVRTGPAKAKVNKTTQKLVTFDGTRDISSAAALDGRNLDVTSTAAGGSGRSGENMSLPVSSLEPSEKLNDNERLNNSVQTLLDRFRTGGPEKETTKVDIKQMRLEDVGASCSDAVDNTTDNSLMTSRICQVPEKTLFPTHSSRSLSITSSTNETKTVQSALTDVIHMVQDWDLDQRRKPEEIKDKNTHGSVTLQKVDDYLDCYFSKRSTLTKEEESQEDTRHRKRTKKLNKTLKKEKKKITPPKYTLCNTTEIVEAIRSFLPAMLDAVQSTPTKSKAADSCSKTSEEPTRTSGTLSKKSRDGGSSQKRTTSRSKIKRTPTAVSPLHPPEGAAELNGTCGNSVAVSRVSKSGNMNVTFTTSSSSPTVRQKSGLSALGGATYPGITRSMPDGVRDRWSEEIEDTCSISTATTGETESMADTGPISIILTDIIQRAGRDVNDLMHKFHHWDVEECGVSGMKADEVPLGPASLEKVNDYLDSFFASKAVHTEERAREASDIRGRGLPKKSRDQKQKKQVPLDSNAYTTGEIVDAVRSFLPSMLDVVRNAPVKNMLEDSNSEETCIDSVAVIKDSVGDVPSQRTLSSCATRSVDNRIPSPPFPSPPPPGELTGVSITLRTTDILDEFTTAAVTETEETSTLEAIETSSEAFEETHYFPETKSSHRHLSRSKKSKTCSTVATVQTDKNLFSFAQALLDGFMRADPTIKMPTPDVTQICSKALQEEPYKTCPPLPQEEPNAWSSSTLSTTCGDSPQTTSVSLEPRAAALGDTTLKDTSPAPLDGVKNDTVKNQSELVNLEETDSRGETGEDVTEGCEVRPSPASWSPTTVAETDGTPPAVGLNIEGGVCHDIQPTVPRDVEHVVVSSSFCSGPEASRNSTVPPTPVPATLTDGITTSIWDGDVTVPAEDQVDTDVTDITDSCCEASVQTNHICADGAGHVGDEDHVDRITLDCTLSPPALSLQTAQIVNNDHLISFTQALLDGFMTVESQTAAPTPDVSHICSIAVHCSKPEPQGGNNSIGPDTRPLTEHSAVVRPISPPTEDIPASVPTGITPGERRKDEHDTFTAEVTGSQSLVFDETCGLPLPVSETRDEDTVQVMRLSPGHSCRSAERRKKTPEHVSLESRETEFINKTTLFRSKGRGTTQTTVPKLLTPEEELDISVMRNRASSADPQNEKDTSHHEADDSCFEALSDATVPGITPAMLSRVPRTADDKDVETFKPKVEELYLGTYEETCVVPEDTGPYESPAKRSPSTTGLQGSIQSLDFSTSTTAEKEEISISDVADSGSELFQMTSIISSSMSKDSEDKEIPEEIPSSRRSTRSEVSRNSTRVDRTRSSQPCTSLDVETVTVPETYHLSSHSASVERNRKDCSAPPAKTFAQPLSSVTSSAEAEMCSGFKDTESVVLSEPGENIQVPDKEPSSSRSARSQDARKSVFSVPTNASATDDRLPCLTPAIFEASLCSFSQAVLNGLLKALAETDAETIASESVVADSCSHTFDRIMTQVGLDKNVAKSKPRKEPGPFSLRQRNKVHPLPLETCNLYSQSCPRTSFTTEGRLLSPCHGFQEKDKKKSTWRKFFNLRHRNKVHLQQQEFSQSYSHSLQPFSTEEHVPCEDKVSEIQDKDSKQRSVWRQIFGLKPKNKIHSLQT